MLQFCLFGVEFPIVIDMMPQMLHLVIWHALRNGISVCKCSIIENAAMVIIIIEIIALSSCMLLFRIRHSEYSIKIPGNSL